MWKRAKQGIRIVLDKVGGEGNQGYGSRQLSLSLLLASQATVNDVDKQRYVPGG